MNIDPHGLRATGKDGYDCLKTFRERAVVAQEQAKTDRGSLENSAVMAGQNRLWSWEALLTDATFHVLTDAVPYLWTLRNYRVLDIGCGYGRCAPFLSMFDCAAYLGIDATEARLDWAKSRYSTPVVRFECVDARTFRTAEPFDVIWCCTVLQHMVIPDKLATIEAIKRAMKPNGVALLCEDVCRGDGDASYASPKRGSDLPPLTFSELQEAFAPLVVRPISKTMLFEIKSKDTPELAMRSAFVNPGVNA